MGGEERFPDVNSVVPINNKVIHLKKVAARDSDYGANLIRAFFGRQHVSFQSRRSKRGKAICSDLRIRDFSLGANGKVPCEFQFEEVNRVGPLGPDLRAGRPPIRESVGEKGTSRRAARRSAPTRACVPHQTKIPRRSHTVSTKAPVRVFSCY